VDFAQIVGGLAQAVSVITIIIAAYQIWQARKDALPGVIINIGEKDERGKFSIFLTNIKTPPVFVRSYEMRYYVEKVVTLKRDKLDDKYAFPSVPKNDSKNLLKIGDTFIVSLIQNCFYISPTIRTITTLPGAEITETKISNNDYPSAFILRIFLMKLANKLTGRPFPFAEFRFKIPGLPDPRVYFYLIKESLYENSYKSYKSVIYATNKKCKNEKSIKEEGIVVSVFEFFRDYTPDNEEDVYQVLKLPVKYMDFTENEEDVCELPWE